MTIEWQLNVLMAQRRINNKELAEKTGMHPVTISKLKNYLEMPDRLEKDTLEKLCSSLRCQPGDLMKWEDNSNELDFFTQGTKKEKRDKIKKV